MGLDFGAFAALADAMIWSELGAKYPLAAALIIFIALLLVKREDD
jgi:hypothetical protein